MSTTTPEQRITTADRAGRPGRKAGDLLRFMVLLLVAVGFGVGSVELLIWIALLVTGFAVIAKRHSRH